MQGGKIFINYRREDSAGYARSLFDRLSARFPNHVFMDVSVLEPGVDFVEAIETAVGGCDALVVMIGRNWLSITDAAGTPRLMDPKDFVGLEITAALKRGVRVIPALVGGSKMPAAKDLPSDLEPLTRRHALELTDQDWDYGVDRLIKAIERVLAEGTKDKKAEPSPVERELEPVRREVPPLPASKPRPWILTQTGAFIIALVVAGLVAGLWLFSQRTVDPKLLPVKKEAPVPAPAIDRKAVADAVAKGDTHYEAGEYKKAIEEYQRVLDLDPAEATVRAKIERARSAEAAEQQYK